LKTELNSDLKNDTVSHLKNIHINTFENQQFVDFININANPAIKGKT